MVSCRRSSRRSSTARSGAPRSACGTPIRSPDDGVLVQGGYCEPGWVYADLDPRATDLARTEGQVFNFRHGSEAAARAVDAVVTETI